MPMAVHRSEAFDVAIPVIGLGIAEIFAVAMSDPIRRQDVEARAVEACGHGCIFGTCHTEAVQAYDLALRPGDPPFTQGDHGSLAGDDGFERGLAFVAHARCSSPFGASGADETRQIAHGGL